MKWGARRGHAKNMQLLIPFLQPFFCLSTFCAHFWTWLLARVVVIVVVVGALLLLLRCLYCRHLVVLIRIVSEGEAAAPDNKDKKVGRI
jgi:hypothetical protein